MKIFYLLFLVFLFMSCAERGNEEKKVMILGVTPEQIVELKGEELPIQELIPTSICRLDSFLVILNGKSNINLWIGVWPISYTDRFLS